MANKFQNFLRTRQELRKCTPVNGTLPRLQGLRLSLCGLTRERMCALVVATTAGAAQMESEQQSLASRGALQAMRRRGRGGGRTGAC